ADARSGHPRGAAAASARAPPRPPRARTRGSGRSARDRPARATAPSSPAGPGARCARGSPRSASSCPTSTRAGRAIGDGSSGGAARRRPMRPTEARLTTSPARPSRTRRGQARAPRATVRPPPPPGPGLANDRPALVVAPAPPDLEVSRREALLPEAESSRQLAGGMVPRLDVRLQAVEAEAPEGVAQDERQALGHVPLPRVRA